MDEKEAWARCVAFHGHECGGLTIGMAGASNQTLVCFMQEAFREYSERGILQLKREN